MVVMIVEKAPRSLRGILSRWLLEIVPGVFVGDVSARVRKLLWERSMKNMKTDGRICLLWKTNNEQGFDLKIYGFSDREIVDLDGFKWVAVKDAAWKRKMNQNIKHKMFFDNQKEKANFKNGQ